MKYTLREDIQVDTFSDGEMVVYDPRTEMIHVLNAMAALVLNILLSDEELPQERFVEAVFKIDPDVSRTTVQKDFENIVNDFIEADFVTVR